MLRRIMLSLCLLLAACTSAKPLPAPTATAPAVALPAPEQTHPAELTPVASLAPLTQAAPDLKQPTLTPIPGGCPIPSGWITYTVQPGDTLYFLGQLIDTPYEEIMSGNCLASDLLYPGDVLALPALPALPTGAPGGQPFVPQPFPTDVPPAFTAPEMLAYGGGAGGDCGTPSGSVLEMKLGGPINKDDLQAFSLCLFNFPAGELLTLELTMSDGRAASAKYLVPPASVTRLDCTDANCEKATLLDIDLFWNLNMPPGEWRARASTPSGAAAEITFSVGEWAVGDAKWYSRSIVMAHQPPILDDVPFSPFEPRYSVHYHLGDSVHLMGRNFPERTQVWLGVYVNGKLADHFLVLTNKRGRFNYVYKIPDQLVGPEFDVYHLVATDFLLFMEDPAVPGSPPPFSDGYVVFDVQPVLAVYETCLSAPSPMSIGQQVSWQTTSSVYNSVYKNFEIGQLQPGEVVIVLDGPICLNGVAWWKIHSLSSGLYGWVVKN